MCFKRPDYLEETITSLENAEEANEVNWYVFQDGAENKLTGEIYATQEELDSVSKIINNSTLPIKEFIQQENNISPVNRDT